MIVWLASYPRSGNTFLRIILNKIFDIKTYSIYDDKNDIGDDKETSNVVGHQFLPEDFDVEKLRDENDVYYIKTHELPDDCVHDSDRVIYLVRDGRESTLSLSNYVRDFGNQCSLTDIIYGNVFSGGWGDHLKAWGPLNRKNTLLVRFEDLIDELKKNIEEISAFINVDPNSNELPAFEDLKKINPKFFRSGKKDSWREVFTEQDCVSFWFRNYSQMIAYGYKSDMPVFFEKNESYVFINQMVNDSSYLLKQFYKVRDEYANSRFLESKIASQQILLSERNNRIINLEESLNQKNLQMKKRLDLIEQQGQRAKEQQTVLSQREQQIKEQQTVLEQREQKIKEQQTVLEQRERKIKEQQTVLEQREQKIKEQQTVLEQREQQIKEQQTVLEQWEQKIKEQQKQLAQQDHRINEQADMFAERDKELDRCHEDLSNKNNIIVDKTKALDDILTSKKYKLITALAKPYMKVKGKL